MRRTIAAAILALPLTACGSHHTGPGIAVVPDCLIWGKRLATLPVDYAGCSQPDSSVVPAVGTVCKSGPALVRYFHSWAFEGGGVHVASGPLGKDAGYEAALKACRG